MKILHVSDLHGSVIKYNLLKKIVNNNNIDVVVNSGNISLKNYPLNILIKKQKEFFENFYKTDILDFFESKKIYYLSFLGNDDLKVNSDMYKELHNMYDFCYDLRNSNTLNIKNYKFIGFNLVPDYPFQLKDWVRQDNRTIFEHRQFGPAVLSDIKKNCGYRVINDWNLWLQQTKSIEEELNDCVQKWKKIDNKTIFVCHTPPIGLKIDLLTNLQAVGSKSVADFIAKYQPIISLHGHIHEAFQVSNKYFGKINKTICFNPGQKLQKLPFIIINLENMEHSYDEI